MQTVGNKSEFGGKSSFWSCCLSAYKSMRLNDEHSILAGLELLLSCVAMLTVVT